MCVLVPVIMPGQAEGKWWERNLSKTELSAVVDFRVQGKMADPKWLEQVSFGGGNLQFVQPPNDDPLPPNTDEALTPGPGGM